MKMTTLGLVQGRLSLISIAAFWRASASALKLVEYFPVAMVMRASPSLYLMYTPPPLSRVASAAEPKWFAICTQVTTDVRHDTIFSANVCDLSFSHVSFAMSVNESCL